MKYILRDSKKVKVSNQEARKHVKTKGVVLSQSGPSHTKAKPR